MLLLVAWLNVCFVFVWRFGLLSGVSYFGCCLHFGLVSLFRCLFWFGLVG